MAHEPRTPRGTTPGGGPALARRTFLAGAGAAGGGLVAALALRAGRARGAPGPLYVSCRAEGEAANFVTGFDPAGRVRFDLPLPGRGHAIAFHPRRPEGVAFARRPGYFAVVFDHAEGVALRRIDAAAGRHFYGHGAYSADGRHLFTSENHVATGQGRIGIHDAADGYRRVGELPSHGIGPHDLCLMPDGKTLAAANGGIATDPDFGRAKLNLESMRPTLAFVDPATGAELDGFALGPRLHRLSIRHLDAAPDGRVAVAMQYEGDRRDLVPLVGVFEGGAIRLFEESAPLARRLRHYTGAVAFDPSCRLIALSSPRANVFTVWDAASGALLHEVPIRDGCGVTRGLAPGEFLMTGAAGRVERFDALRGVAESVPVDRAGDWDNHAGLEAPA
jgi:hypothetical protein